MDRRSLRSRKVSQKLATVDEDARKRAKNARLEALENDTAVLDDFETVDSDDEEFVLGEGSEEENVQLSRGKKVKGGRKKKKGRGATLGRKRGPQTWQEWIEEENLEEASIFEPNYVSAAVNRPRVKTPRSFCSVCGQIAPYTCVRCGTRFCCLRCSTIHGETRCLKFAS